MASLFLKTAPIAAISILINAAALPPQSVMAQPAVQRTDLQRHDLATIRPEAVQVRIDFAPGGAFGRHSHREEIIYVLNGFA